MTDMEMLAGMDVLDDQINYNAKTKAINVKLSIKLMPD